MSRASTLALILLVQGCAGTGDRIDPVELAKHTLEATLTRKDSLSYREVRLYRDDVVCGEVNAQSRWGEGAGFKHFIVRGAHVNPQPSADDLDIFCSDDPAERLQARFGIGPLDPQNTSLLSVRKQMQELDDALQRYLLDHRGFPKTSEGLAVLLQAAKSSDGTRRPYLEQVPDDPWGRPYHYENRRQLHGEAKVYSLYTLGRDGATGGRGEDADIGNWQLKYLDHIAPL